MLYRLDAYDHQHNNIFIAWTFKVMFVVARKYVGESRTALVSAPVIRGFEVIHVTSENRLA